ncbi:MAG: SDR family NAD(P)-dependent oxidoreductase, partial [Chloroflexota bacterium]
MSEFENKVVIVTGGAKGIGRGICEAFAKDGANVMCADVDAEAGAALVDEAKGWTGSLYFYKADVSQGNECQALVTETVSALGGVDIVCNNVGIQPVASYVRAHEMSDEMWDRILDVNLKSAFLMTKYTVPEMQKRGGGVIINTASVQGLQSANKVPAYAASKGGILSLTQQLALDYAEDNIRVLAVNPGTIETPLVVEAAEADGVSVEEKKGEWGKAHPLGRIGQPIEIGNVVVFLASDRAGFMTGSY